MVALVVAVWDAPVATAIVLHVKVQCPIVALAVTEIVIAPAVATETAVAMEIAEVAPAVVAMEIVVAAAVVLVASAVQWGLAPTTRVAVLAALAVLVARAVIAALVSVPRSAAGNRKTEREEREVTFLLSSCLTRSSVGRTKGAERSPLCLVESYKNKKHYLGKRVICRPKRS